MVKIMQSIRTLLGRRIRELRQAKNLSQQELAEQIGIDQRNLSNIECGNTFPSRSLTRLAKALNIDLQELFDFEHYTTDESYMREYIQNNLNSLSPADLKTVYRLIKSMH